MGLVKKEVTRTLAEIRTRRADLEAMIRATRAAGVKDHAIGIRTGYSREQVNRVRRRLGLPSSRPRWTAAEEKTLARLMRGRTLVVKWKAIAAALPGRSPLAVKTKWQAMTRTQG